MPFTSHCGHLLIKEKIVARFCRNKEVSTTEVIHVLLAVYSGLNTSINSIIRSSWVALNVSCTKASIKTSHLPCSHLRSWPFTLMPQEGKPAGTFKPKWQRYTELVYYLPDNAVIPDKSLRNSPQNLSPKENYLAFEMLPRSLCNQKKNQINWTKFYGLTYDKDKAHYPLLKTTYFKYILRPNSYYFWIHRNNHVISWRIKRKPTHCGRKYFWPNHGNRRCRLR